MSDERPVLMSAEQHAEIERHIVELMRANRNERASLMMHLASAWRFAKPVESVLPSNVYPIVRHAGDSWSRRVPTG